MLINKRLSAFKTVRRDRRFSQIFLVTWRERHVQGDQDIYFISTTVLQCTIFCQLFSTSIDWAIITREPIELEKRCFHRKICLIITPSQRFWSNIIVWVPNLQQTLKQKFCYLENGTLIKRSHFYLYVV